jgi:hypothetical protein
MDIKFRKIDVQHHYNIQDIECCTVQPEYKLSNIHMYIYIYIYREDFYSLDEFMALHFTATGAPPAARRMRILPMNQHA